MCQSTKTTTVSKEVSTLRHQLWPLPPFLAVGVLCCLIPPAQWLNRGFTHWFHLVSFYYFLTHSKFIEKFQALIGISICLGWYASILYDYFAYGHVFAILYRNMPAALTNIMVKDGIIDYESPESLRIMALSHILDCLGHPILTYYFWCQYKKQSCGGTGIANTASSSTLLTWDVVAATWCFSRVWSLTHSYHNFGSPLMYYMGYDVYVIDEGTLDLWYPAYITESLIYTSIVLWKLRGMLSQPGKEVSKDDEDVYNQKPSLRYSESSVSRSSIATNLDRYDESM
eukprot:scaffold22779_cov137-Cylindrotheca_fusiformis.AAC.4